MNSTKTLYIVGAGGFGRELFEWLSDPDVAGEDWVIGGFLDADPGALEGFDLGVPILGDPRTYTPRESDRFTCAIGEPTVKLRVCRDLQSRGARFATVIHPTAVVGRSCRLGEGCIVLGFASLSAHVTLGAFVTVNGYSGAGHDVVIGDGSTLSSHCDITGNVVLGEGVFLGSHASILPGKKVGDYARVGAGSVVVRNVPPGTTVMGVPAKRIAGFGPGE